MSRLSQLLGAAAVVAVVALAPTAAVASEAHPTTQTEIRSDEATTPTPSPVPTPTELSVPTSSSDGGSGVQDALVVLGFAVIAMAGFILIIRAGLRSANSEDTD